MKFKSQDDVEGVTQPQTEEKCNCPICQAIGIASSQIDLIYSLLSSLKSTIDTLNNLHEKHDSE